MQSGMKCSINVCETHLISSMDQLCFLFVDFFFGLVDMSIVESGVMNFSNMIVLELIYSFRTPSIHFIKPGALASDEYTLPMVIFFKMMFDHYIVTFFVSSHNFCLKVYIFGCKYSCPCSLMVSICMNIFLNPFIFILTICLCQ